MLLREVDKKRIRFSQCSISRHFGDGITPVETWVVSKPYTIPIEVMKINEEEYISLDNRRLYSTKKYCNNDNMNCIVYNCDDALTKRMVNYGKDILTILWQTDDVTHKLTLRAMTVEGVFIIRCAGQNSKFSLSGSLDSPFLGARQASKDQIMLEPFNTIFTATDEDHKESLKQASTVYIQPVHRTNLFHIRPDLAKLIIETNLFEAIRYERGTNIKLVAHGQRETDSWDDWDDLNAAAFEAENEIDSLYDEDFLRDLKLNALTNAMMFQLKF